MRQNLTIFSLSNLLVFFSFFSLITVHEVNCDNSSGIDKPAASSCEGLRGLHFSEQSLTSRAVVQFAGNYYNMRQAAAGAFVP